MSEKSLLKNFQNPEETRKYEKVKIDLVELGMATVGRAIFEPGWRWSTHLKEVSGTNSCLAPHLQYHVSGVLHVLMDDGTEFDCHPGDITYLPAGHDAWTIGDEPAVVIDFHGMLDYAIEKQELAERKFNRLIMESPLPTLVHYGDANQGKVKMNDRLISLLNSNNKPIEDMNTWWEAFFPNLEYQSDIKQEWSKRREESQDGQVEPVQISISIGNSASEYKFEVHLTTAGEQTIAVFVDVTEQLKLQEALSYDAIHDELTGLLNRRGYTQKLNELWKACIATDQKLFFLLLDVDYFKKYNDTYGHNLGDECLKKVAQSLKKSISRSRDIVARIGGEEFAICIAADDVESVLKIAENVRQSIQDLSIPHESSPAAEVVTVSVGVAFDQSKQVTTTERLYEAADLQLYEAKQNGRNRVSYQKDEEELTAV